MTFSPLVIASKSATSSWCGQVGPFRTFQSACNRVKECNRPLTLLPTCVPSSFMRCLVKFWLRDFTLFSVCYTVLSAVKFRKYPPVFRRKTICETPIFRLVHLLGMEVSTELVILQVAVGDGGVIVLYRQQYKSPLHKKTATSQWKHRHRSRVGNSA